MISIEFPTMASRLTTLFAPPLLAATTGFFVLWGMASNRTEAAEQRQHQTEQVQAQHEIEHQDRHRRFTLEIRGVGLTLHRFRQGRLWEAIDKRNDAFQSPLSQNPQDYEWSDRGRSQDYDKREADAFESTLNGWVERWPIPILVAGPVSLDAPALRINRGRQNGGMAIHLFTVLDQREGDGSDQLIAQLFDFFDRHPQLPAAVLLSGDSQELRATRIRNGHFVPTIPDSIVALLVTRSDRVDRDIRPYVVDVPYDINKLDTQYDVIQLWHDYWNADTAYHKLPDNHTTMPWQFWHEHQQKLIARIDPDGSQGQLLAFWKRKAGFKPSPWVPVRWTEWQLRQYDNAPLLGYLHRPVEVPLDAPTGPQGDRHRAAAMAEAWKQALATLPEGAAPQRLFYDTAGEGRRLIPLALAMSAEATPNPLAIDDPANSYDLTRRVADTGVSSPFVQLALALMRSYHQGGASATINLREDARASIVMVSPPSNAQKTANPRQPDPFFNPNAPRF
ncbi:DUF2875 family protein [Azoarcus sp. DD4]|uniref:type VI lipase adapter Tla3 domain-containing protein n=1 Tax=Azoarcus sp. DD4 TaxID=2027405 RepID=UPI00143CDC2F|nr:DUF2875 family protein [Azoarcus sp. DD4]